MRYLDFRAPDQPRFKDAQIVMLFRAKQLAAEGDYTKPCRRTAILGYMHEWKQMFWELHIEQCVQGREELRCPF